MRWKWSKRRRDTPPRRRSHDAGAGSRERRQGEIPRRTEGRGSALFRRNRTLVGSSSSAFGSASELTGDLRSPRAHAHHLTAHRRRLGGMLILVAGAACLLTWVLYEFTATIHVLPTTSSIILQPERYQRAINDYFASHPAQRLRVLLDKTQLEGYLQHAVPEVEAITSVSPAGFTASRFIVVFRQPVASWLIGSDQYYVDKYGVPFQSNHFAQPSVKIIDRSGIPQTTGAAVASSRFLRFVGMSVDVARTYGLTVKEAIIPANTTRQIELKVMKHPYPVRLSLDRPVGEQIEDMKRAIRYLEKRKIVPDYIDVRVAGKAYYR